MFEKQSKKERLLSSRHAGYSSFKEGQYRPVSSDICHEPRTSASVHAPQRVTYSWKNIDVYMDVNQGNLISRLFKRKHVNQKRILNNVTGVAQPGEFLAIMGASGAGKTTLLNTLTFRNMGKLQVSGERYINGMPVDPDSLARISGYVQQDDLFIGTLTVKEHLRFQALLRMDRNLSYSERMFRVEEVIMELGLSKSANTVIGDPAKGIKGISGGEMKRLAFASEVLTNPSLMFCDEPTSGLDSYMAQNIVQVLRNIAQTGKTVICTIHQPSSEVFAMFDRILLMAESRTAFLGPVDQALSFFSSQGLPCPPNYNPGDFYIHSLATVPGQENESRKRVREICNAFEACDMGRNISRMAAENQKVAGINQDFNGRLAYKKGSPYKASWWTQFTAVLWRSCLSVLREPQVIKVKAFQTLFISVLIALIYQGQTYTQKNISNIQGVLFVFLTNMTFQNVFGVVNVITSELPIFLREHFNGMYRTDVYFLCKTLAEMPIYIVFPCIFISIPYFIIGLNSDMARFFMAVAIVVLVANVATSFGYFVSCMASSTQVALSLSAPMIIPMLLFGGFFLNNGSVPYYFDWLRYLSWFMYANEALSINQWQGVSFNDTTSTCPNFVCTGEAILKVFDFNPGFFWRDIYCLFALIVGFRVLALFSLLVKARKTS